MPIKRRSKKVREHRVTPEAIEAFHAGDRKALHRALDLKPWQSSPIDADGDCPWPDGSMGFASWALASELRTEIMEASHAH